MKRKEAINKLSVLSLAATFGPSFFFSGCSLSENKISVLSEKEIPLLDEIGEIILPTTTTSAGAKAAGIGTYMVTIVNECFHDENQNIFISGLNKLNESCLQQYKKPFLQLSAKDKKTMLTQLDTESKTTAKKNQPEHYFSMLRRLTISGYISSQIGATQAYRYEAVPGRFEGCIVFKPTDKPWATE